jgi:hypothetical protein
MTTQITRDQIAEKAIIHSTVYRPTSVIRSFELPAALFALTAACYLGFLALMAAVFSAPALAIPIFIMVLTIIVGFGLPFVWTQMKPDHGDRNLDWGRFCARGIQTFTGPVTAGEAAAQVLVLPVLILGWGVAVILVAAIVR